MRGSESQELRKGTVVFLVAGLIQYHFPFTRRGWRWVPEMISRLDGHSILVWTLAFEYSRNISADLRNTDLVRITHCNHFWGAGRWERSLGAILLGRLRPILLEQSFSQVLCCLWRYHWSKLGSIRRPGHSKFEVVFCIKKIKMAIASWVENQNRQ